jgi:hypothetical protein
MHIRKINCTIHLSNQLIHIMIGFKMAWVFCYTLSGHEWHFLIKTMPEASQPVAGG